MDLGTPLRGVAEILPMHDAYTDVGARQRLEHVVEQLAVLQFISLRPKP
jgi:hypothetical protein